MRDPNKTNQATVAAAPPLEPPTLLSPSPPADTGTFRCDGDTRTIRYGGRAVLMRELKGFRYLQRLLADPGREFHVLDLIAVENGSLPSAHTGRDDISGSTAGVGAGLPMIDDTAREAYRRRLADIDEATQMNDSGRIELAQRDRQYLVTELTRAVALGHRPRSSAAAPNEPAPA